jgi:hypothetical protein
MVCRNPRGLTALGIAAASENGLLVRKSDIELNRNSPPGVETPSLLSRIRSIPRPNLTE